MSSGTDYVNYILEQLSCAGLARARRMFGEYGLYLDGMFFAVICDDELFIKPTQAALAAFPELPLAPPYAGAKDYIRVEDTDDAAALCALVRLTCEALAELPQPKRRKRNAP